MLTWWIVFFGPALPGVSVTPVTPNAGQGAPRGGTWLKPGSSPPRLNLPKPVRPAWATALASDVVEVFEGRAEALGSRAGTAVARSSDIIRLIEGAGLPAAAGIYNPSREELRRLVLAMRAALS